MGKTGQSSLIVSPMNFPVKVMPEDMMEAALIPGEELPKVRVGSVDPT